MANNQWALADLNGERLRMLKEAEQTLGADILLAYERDKQPGVEETRLSESGLRVARLTEAQVECLRGLETKTQAVVIAYQRANPPA